jgi:hypothetical protein
MGIRRFVARSCGFKVSSSFGRLGVSFNKPQPFINTARDFREQIGWISITQLVCLINGITRFMTERGQGLENRLDVRAAIGNGQRVFFNCSALLLMFDFHVVLGSLLFRSAAMHSISSEKPTDAQHSVHIV